MPKFFSEDYKKQLVDYYNAGESVQSICKNNNVSKSSLYNWIRLYSRIKSEGKIVFTGKEVYQLKKEVQMLKEENEILKHCSCSITSETLVKIEEIKKLDKNYSMHALSRALDIRRSVLYYHLSYRRPETSYECNDEKIKPIIKAVFEESRNRFGSRMIRAKLMENGIIISQERTSRLMKEMGLVCNTSKKLLPEYKRQYPYSRSAYCTNKLHRNFNQEHPNRVWVSDITYIRTLERIYYLCVIIDLYSRFIISYSISDIADSAMVVSTLKKAFIKRGKPEGLMFHSDQGAQYTSATFRNTLKKLKINQSFSNAGCPYDNAVAETFFASLKREELYQHIYNGFNDLKMAVDEYIIFFNNKQPYQRLGYKTPQFIEENYKSI